MNTITFYSYKGGVGRTLALANVARYLAQLGKRVVCADFDFEAPGLHYKFGVSSDSIQAGMVDIVAEFVDRGQVRSIAELAIEASVEHSRGSVHLLAAGRAPHPDYWRTLGSIDWHRLFFDRDRQQPGGIELFLEIQQQVQESLEPDYLLIDARTGITEVGGIALSLLADAVVCVLAHNRENLDGARAVLRSIRAAPRLNIEKEIRLLPVLSRIPANLEPGEEEELLESVLAFLNESIDGGRESLGLGQIFVFHSEPRLQVQETLKVPDAGTVEESTLLRDYLDLFRVLIPREDVVSGLSPLLERERQRAFDDPDVAQGSLESLAFLYPTRETALALLQLYVLRNLSADRVLQAAKRLYEITSNPHEPALRQVLEEHGSQLEAGDIEGFQMGFEVWKAQIPGNGKLAAELVKRAPLSLSIDTVVHVLRQAPRPEPALANAAFEGLVSRGKAQEAVDLAAELMPVLAKSSQFLEARVAAVIALGEEKTAKDLVDELEPVHERLTKLTWYKLLTVARVEFAGFEQIQEVIRELVQKVEQNRGLQNEDLVDQVSSAIVTLNEEDLVELLLEPLAEVADFDFLGRLRSRLRRFSELGKDRERIEVLLTPYRKVLRQGGLLQSLFPPDFDR